MSGSAICCKGARSGYHARPTATAICLIYPISAVLVRDRKVRSGADPAVSTGWWVAGMVQTPQLARRLQEKGGPREPATRWVLPMQVAGSESQEIKISVVNYAG